jgi:hypothetical protein
MPIFPWDLIGMTILELQTANGFASLNKFPNRQAGKIVISFME